jgi:hypothetical protein
LEFEVQARNLSLFESMNLKK